MPGRTSRAPSALVDMARRPSVSPMCVEIDNHYQQKTYTTSSAVSGNVCIHPDFHDLYFNSVQILLLGTSTTHVDSLNLPQATTHTFLKLTMPIPNSIYPDSGCLTAGATLKIPFHFVIPQHLTLNACGHHITNDALREQHMHLLPSIGNWEKDDFSPKMSRISYRVRARAFRDDGNGEFTKVLEASQEINVIPMSTEEAPLNITPQDKLYVMSKTKSLRKSIISPKSGKITVSASQLSAPLVMSPEGRSITPTTAQLDFVFEPSSNESQPPKINAVSSKITAVTYYSTGGISEFPNLKDWVRTGYSMYGHGSYSNSTSLASTSIESPHWKQRLCERARRDSGYDSAHASDSDQSTEQRRQMRTRKGSPYYYTAKLQVPVEVSTEKRQFLPTFHSCITSRVYVLSMTVSLSTLAGVTSSITLAVPIQICVGPREGTSFDATGLPTFDAAMEEAGLEVDAYLQPRTIAVPDVEFQSQLPGYA
ncbi:arrestin [Xylariaceae sp. FL0255]|nr:arrestin [Xylariaceae sp. FL0255]